ncbi:seven transmembrane MLO family protein [Actinidia rufa]|uniref:MLO-like protein n=1 Tax=Actinidia rufa TaxID=165716 RepID=A0A7J0EMP3_9ERIC|nr:seven transmembrane MLO family protein [Actinidia rufa]
MAGDSSYSSSRELDQTPTWAVSGVCAIIIIISIVLEKILHKLGMWFTERHKKALFEALEKVKAELMVLGFISLLLTFSQYYIAKICIPTKVADTMLPCPATEKSKTDDRRRLLWYEHRMLAGAYSSSCKGDKVPIITVDGLHQLHILIFFLAVFHVVYSAVTMALGRLKGCFIRQFFRSVNKSDYLTLRHGFISIILAVGTKLQAVLTRMALDITERHAVVQGIPLVQGSDKYFWFGRPQLVLHLIHFALFQYEFGLKSCFHDNFKLVIAKIALGVGVLCLCSYITLPLYALIAQMGSHMKKSIFDEQTSKALKKWHMAVKKKHGKGGKSPSRAMVESSTKSMSSTLHSSGPTLHRFKTTGHSTRSSSYEEHETSDFDEEPPSPTSSTTNLLVRVDHDDSEIEASQPHTGDGSRHGDDFSFVKPAPLK